jgi:hypothetical protein
MGRKQDGGEQPNLQLDAELARLNALPLPQLAAEVMTKGFSADDDPTVTPVEASFLVHDFCPVPRPDIHWGRALLRVLLLFATCGMSVYGGIRRRAKEARDPTSDLSKYARLEDLIGEGLQALEKASLVEPKTSWDGVATHLGYVTTRLGRDALAQNAVDRVLAGGTL